VNLSNGLIRTPTAWLNDEGEIAFLYSNIDPFTHGRFTLSPYSWVQGSFYYTDMNTIRYGGTRQSNKDKGFALKFKIKDQDIFPAISIGFEDIAGTALFSSEYVVSSYRMNKLDISVGLGWGRLGSLNNASNPLYILNRNFKSRSGNTNRYGGTFAIENYFRGDASIFGGLKYTPFKDKNFAFKVEYDSMNFNSQIGYNAKEATRYNYGISLEPYKNTSLSLYRTEGNDLGFSFQFKKNFSRIKKDFFQEQPVTRTENISYIKILNDGAKNGVLVQNANINKDEIKIKYIQTKTNNEKVFAKEYENYLREKYYGTENFILIPQNGVLVKEEYSFKRGSLKSIESEHSAKDKEYEFNPMILYPVNSYNISPGFKSHIGSPSGFFFGEINLSLYLNSIINKGLEFESLYTYPLIDNYKNLNYNPAYTDLYPVRIDTQKYLKQGKHGFDTFYISKISQFSLDNYILFSLGHLEQMYSGAYFEYLKDFADLNLMLGFELSYVKQRDFDKGFFNFLDYQTYTSHINVSYYEPYFDLYADLSFGRYLAKDDGFTLSLSRGFKNGLEIGAFFTITNINKWQFGEGSFDKGIFFNYPIDIFRKSKSKGYNSFLYRPLTRDGGSKVSISKNLISILRDPSQINY
jgi:hypothetical protein